MDEIEDEMENEVNQAEVNEFRFNEICSVHLCTVCKAVGKFRVNISAETPFTEMESIIKCECGEELLIGLDPSSSDSRYIATKIFYTKKEYSKCSK